MSVLDSVIPLYDAYSNNLYIISKFNVYNRVVYNHYRFPTKNFIKHLEDSREKLASEINKGDVLQQRKYRKLTYMIPFLKSFDIDVLYKTYMSVFYLYANEVGKNITLCKKPSFLPHFTHLNPYYSRSEVINLALNKGIKLEERYYDNNDIDSLCNKIIDNDISSKILLEHQKYMISENKVGLVQYYTLQGSFFMNQYLRNNVYYEYQNVTLENLITPMWQLLINAPAFDKSYTLYRFVAEDSYLRNLDIGDIYIEPAFISTTRDPFYRSDLYKFGFILIIIKIPANVKGVGLCIETLSHFPQEQEIILPPLTMLRLDKTDSKIEYFHTDENFKSQIKKRYEFTYIGKKEPRFVDRPAYEDKTIIDFIDLTNSHNVETLTIEEKIKYFINTHLNALHQINVKIGENIFTVIAERYDSTAAYKKFYAITTKNGFLMYTIHNNYILFTIEIGEDDDGRFMSVNYYVKYSTLDRIKILGLDNFIYFISSIALYFALDRVIIWADYRTCDKYLNYHSSEYTQHIQRGFSLNNKLNNDESSMIIKSINKAVQENEFYGGSYCVDFYEYIKNDTKKYKNSNVSTTELQPKFSYHQLSKLKTVSPEALLRKDDQDELYQIYDKIFKPTVTDEQNTVAAFYIWIIENKCYLVEVLISKMDRIFPIDNPFQFDYYILDPITYLYNKRHILAMPKFVTSTSTDIKKNILQKNKYRENQDRKFY